MRRQRRPPTAAIPCAPRLGVWLPRDQYLHQGAPTEWWWHTGTLAAGSRLFGFQINAASFTEVGFTQVMVTDVAAARHLRHTDVFTPGPDFDPRTWAQSDPAQPWTVNLGEVSMHAPQADPTRDMTVAAKFDGDGTPVELDLRLSQEGPPMLVWGSGVMATGEAGPPLAVNNYYYSLTRLHATGTIHLGGQSFDVSGTTWMDHEYGWFGTRSDPITWILQTVQLDNGVTLSNYTGTGEPKLNSPCPSHATVQRADGTTYFVDSKVTPVGKTWKGATGNDYFMELDIEIPCFGAGITVTSLVEAQEFVEPGPVYEGVASAVGVFEDGDVTGTAWNEQNPKPR